MTLTFVEIISFTESVRDYFTNDIEFALFQEFLLKNPERGDLIPGGGGLRKTRWRDLRRGKGARGGLRIIYLYLPDVHRILLLDVYDKDEATDLSNTEKRILAQLAQSYREDVARTLKSKGNVSWKPNDPNSLND